LFVLVLVRGAGAGLAAGAVLAGAAALGGGGGGALLFLLFPAQASPDEIIRAKSIVNFFRILLFIMIELLTLHIGINQFLALHYPKRMKIRNSIKLYPLL
jgi:hypothetical protein